MIFLIDIKMKKILGNISNKIDQKYKTEVDKIWLKQLEKL